MPDTTTRRATNRLLEWVEEGMIDPKHVVLCCVKYMSEDEVADMCHINEFFDIDDEGDDDDDD